MNRKGIFFTVDAVVALIVLTVGVVFIFVTFTGTPIQQQTQLYASDLMNFYRNTRVEDIQEPWLVDMWCTSGPLCTNATHNFTRADQTLLSTFAQMNAEGELPLAQYIASNLSIGLVQKQFSWDLRLIDTEEDKVVFLVNHTFTTTPTQLLTSKALVYYVDENHTLEGPYVAQIDVWQ